MSDDRRLVLTCPDGRTAELLMLEVERLAKSLGLEVTTRCDRLKDDEAR